MYKIMTIVGTRPEIIKLSLVMKELDKYTRQIIVHTGQNYDYELSDIFFDTLEIRKPDYYLDVAGKNAAETIANVIKKSDEIMEIEKPDAILLYGDTNSCLSVISAKRRKIPIFHMEAGNRCFDQKVPEELNRKIVDHLSDINMTITEHARRYLINEGLRPENIIKIGSSMKEVLYYYKTKIEKSKCLEKMNLKEKEYFLISMHREENIEDKSNFNSLIDALIDISKHFEDKKVIVSTHPRTEKKINKKIEMKLGKNIIFMKPFGFIDYIKLQQSAYCVLSDSGTITEEASILGFPAIMIRQVHERPEGMDEGTLIMSGINSKNILHSVNIITKQSEEGTIKIVDDYNIDNVSKKVVRIILSYIEYVNRTVWNKYK
ncbi:UDP-N-acetylglucosamine 2-epimerase [Gottschalkia purinilytica]|uniref:UDP-N-acetylglucosamine 2-epimerase n=1 Tax=Gottschalkia purinilytica TaxID=1503 RepID=A0A0L0WDU5_GOTPU|nr:UDP-N-acetylglucosamine 2-epimerase (non-hydrolyzing) [Gottschalkia purinilytica]KNF09648.1 UDP-N-acetylglucosamine 2-epimerase [Gottschalkia purinilytica]